MVLAVVAAVDGLVVGGLAVLKLYHACLALVEVLFSLVGLGIEAEVDGDDLAVGVTQLGLSEQQNGEAGRR